MYSTTEVFTQENTVVTHEAIKKYVHIDTSILSTYAIYTTFKWMSHFYTISIHQESKMHGCLRIVLVPFKIGLFHS
jgi:hypothetical protein